MVWGGLALAKTFGVRLRACVSLSVLSARVCVCVCLCVRARTCVFTLASSCLPPSGLWLLAPPRNAHLVTCPRYLPAPLPPDPKAKDGAGPSRRSPGTAASASAPPPRRAPPAPRPWP